jgi:hypothetical protein
VSRPWSLPHRDRRVARPDGRPVYDEPTTPGHRRAVRRRYDGTAIRAADFPAILLLVRTTRTTPNHRRGKAMKGTVLSLVELAYDEELSFFGDDQVMTADASSDSNNCGSCDSRGC